jgi:hypothetical protein
VAQIAKILELEHDPNCVTTIVSESIPSIVQGVVLTKVQPYFVKNLVYGTYGSSTIKYPVYHYRM